MEASRHRLVHCKRGSVRTEGVTDDNDPARPDLFGQDRQLPQFCRGRYIFPRDIGPMLAHHGAHPVTELGLIADHFPNGNGLFIGPYQDDRPEELTV